MNEAQRNERRPNRLVMRLMDDAGLCAYGEDTGSYNVPVPAMLSRIGRIVEAAMQLGRDECISEAERLCWAIDNGGKKYRRPADAEHVVSALRKLAHNAAAQTVGESGLIPHD